VVRDVSSGAPLAGVVVSVERAPVGDGRAPSLAGRVAASLTNERGEFELAAPASARIVVTAKRIGVRQYQSPILTVGPGETRALDIGLEGVQYALPAVTISAATPCGTRTADAGGSLRCGPGGAALTANELSLRDRHSERRSRAIGVLACALAVRGRAAAAQHHRTRLRQLPAESLAVIG
jgi:hypothetical protein